MTPMLLLRPRGPGETTRPNARTFRVQGPAIGAPQLSSAVRVKASHLWAGVVDDVDFDKDRHVVLSFGDHHVVGRGHEAVSRHGNLETGLLADLALRALVKRLAVLQVPAR